MEYIYTMNSGGEYTGHHIEFTTLIGEYSVNYHFIYDYQWYQSLGSDQ